MSRIFTDAVALPSRSPGRGLSVVAHRTQEKNGYTASSSASASQGEERLQGERGVRHCALEPKLRLAEFRVAEDKLIPVGAEITADHFTVDNMSMSPE